MIDTVTGKKISSSIVFNMKYSFLFSWKLLVTFDQKMKKSLSHIYQLASRDKKLNNKKNIDKEQN